MRDQENTVNPADVQQIRETEGEPDTARETVGHDHHEEHCHSHEEHTHSHEGHTHEGHAHSHGEHCHSQDGHAHSQEEHAHPHGEHCHSQEEHTHSHEGHTHWGHSHSHGDHHGAISCGCGHCGHEEEGEEEENRNVMIGRLITSAVLLIAGLFFPEGNWIRMLLSFLSAAAAGYDVMIKAVRNALHGRMLDETFLMTIACLGAFLLGEYTEGAMVLLLFQTGEFFQDLAVDRSRESIASLMDICPETATVERDGKKETVSPENVRIGEIIVVKPGERIPLDGTVVDGESFLDTVALTGESVPRTVREGSEALSGCVNLQGVLRIRVIREAHDSAVSRIMELVENATEHKSHADRFITRFARIYTPAVVAAAALILLIGGIVTGNWAEWLRRSLTFLVISCPCALVISVPLSYYNGIGRASRRGILIKGSDILERLSKTGTVAMDKTGTMTQGVFEVVAVHPEEMSEKELIRYALAAEQYSLHPIAEAIRRSEEGMEYPEALHVREIAGQGVLAEIEGHQVACGNDRLMEAERISCHDCHLAGTIVHIAVDGKYEGHLVISDIVKETAGEAVRQLKELGIRRTVMLTGDRKSAAEVIAEGTGVDEYHAELKPDEKVFHVYRLMAEREDGQEAVCFVGDGINDAPVLAAADLGIAMGSAGADAAVEAADIVLIDDDPLKVPEGIRLARRTQKIVRENILFSIAVKLLVMLLGAFGAVPLWLAVFSDVGVCLLAVLNAVR